MSKSTLALVVIATLILGALIGVGVAKKDVASPAAGSSPSGVSSAAPTGSTEGVTANADGVPVIRYLDAATTEVTFDEYGEVVPALSGENYIAGKRAWKQETLSIEIEGDGAIEYKALMDQGEALTYRWSVDGGQVYYDLHAHDVAFGEEFFTRYDEGEGTERAGTMIAPYNGQHGWFWLNLEADPIVVTLQVAGFYDKVIKIDLNAEY